MLLAMKSRSTFINLEDEKRTLFVLVDSRYQHWLNVNTDVANSIHNLVNVSLEASWF